MKKNREPQLVSARHKWWKICMMMKLTVLMSVFFVCTSFGNVFSQQKVSMHLGTTTVKRALTEFQRLTNLVVVYSDDASFVNREVEADFREIEMEEFFRTLLKGSGMDFRVNGKYILISRQEESRQQKMAIVRGIVKDKTGGLLPGVTVVLKGTTLGCVTDSEGAFHMQLPQAGADTLVFSFIGLKTKELKAVFDQPMAVVLEEEEQELEEVVVTGYQKIDRKLFTGSASVIKAKDAVVEGGMDVSRMLQGKAAGVQVQNVSGTFGASPKIRVRGSSSIYGNSNPLWVVDGVVLEDVVEVSADELSSGNAVTLIGSAIAGLNANDIESFQILKDASATALYGARAMNGVIVVTTKKGRKGEVRVNYGLEMTMKMKPSYGSYDILNSQEQMGVYLDMQDKGFFNHADVSRVSDGGIFYKMYDLINTYDATIGKFGMVNTDKARKAYLREAELRNTDWFGLLFKNSIQHNHSLSISGGGEKSSFYASVSYLNDPGWTVADKVERFTANLNSTVHIGKYVDLNLNTSTSLRRQQVPGALDREMDIVSGEYNRNFDINPFSYALNASRTLAAHEKDGGYAYYSMNFAPFNILSESKSNFIDLDYLDSKIQAELSARLFPGFEARVLGALRYVKTTREHKIHENSNLAQAYRAAEDATIRQYNQFLYQDPDHPAALPEVVLPEGGFYNRDDNSLLNYYFRVTANFNRLFADKHNVNVLLGHETKYSDRVFSYNKGYGYQWGKGGVPFVDYRILKQMLEGGFQYYGMNNSYDRFVAFFANIGYSYDERYTLNLTGRYDGSNQLGKSRHARWLPTWNVSGAWHIDREEFMRDAENISTLNLRATYGLTASMGPASTSMAVFRNTISFRPPGDKENQIVLESLENQDLTWEKQYEANVGVDLGLWGNRLSVTADAYYRQGFDLIGLVSGSGTGGEKIKVANYADMDSYGVELTLNTRNIETGHFVWSTNLTFAYNKNEITNLKSTPSVMELVREEGGPREGYPVKGLFSVPFERLNEYGLPVVTDNYGESSSRGVDFQGRDLSFLKYEGSLDPKVTGGFENTFRYKGLALGVFMTYQAGNKIRLYPGFKAFYSDMGAMSRDMLDRWMKPGDEQYTHVPGIMSRRQLSSSVGAERAYNAYNYSDVRVADGGFLRLKDISLSYDFPKSLLQKIKMTTLQLKFVASNVCLLYSDKKLNGQDPEFFRAGGVALPMPRQFTLSLKVGF